MEFDFLLIGVLFLLSSAGVPLYAFITKQHFVRLRTYYAVQASFWLVLAVFSIIAMFYTTGVASIIVNAILGIVGFLFGSYALTIVFKDKGQYLMPYAKENNNDAFLAYGASLDVAHIKVSSLTGNKLDIVHFTDVSVEEKIHFIGEVSANPDLVLEFGTKAALNRLLKSLTFPAIILVFAILMQFGV